MAANNPCLPEIQALQKKIEPLYAKLRANPLYQNIKTIEDLRVFTQIHCFAVWDFMSLIKAIQGAVTCTTVPWTPLSNYRVARLVNDIVLGEETDLDSKDQPRSHYDLYLEGMEGIGAETTRISGLVKKIQSGVHWKKALKKSNLPPRLHNFVKFTLSTVESGRMHDIAAVFAFSRENIIPDMFMGMIRGIEPHKEDSMDALIWYFARHIEVDGEDHGPMSLEMVSHLTGKNKNKWKEVNVAVIKSLEARIDLWDYCNDMIWEARKARMGQGA